jgi:hypothetical protein
VISWAGCAPDGEENSAAKPSTIAPLKSAPLTMRITTPINSSRGQFDVPPPHPNALDSVHRSRAYANRTVLRHVELECRSKICSKKATQGIRGVAGVRGRLWPIALLCAEQQYGGAVAVVVAGQRDRPVGRHIEGSGRVSIASSARRTDKSARLRAIHRGASAKSRRPLAVSSVTASLTTHGRQPAG